MEQRRFSDIRLLPFALQRWNKLRNQIAQMHRIHCEFIEEPSVEIGDGGTLILTVWVGVSEYVCTLPHGTYEWVEK